MCTNVILDDVNHEVRYGAQGNGVFVSEYLVRHPGEYALRVVATRGYGLGVLRSEVELVLLDAQGEFIDEGGCNCDDESPCNNPKCVMDREAESWF